jgi:hypothetical protein
MEERLRSRLERSLGGTPAGGARSRTPNAARPPLLLSAHILFRRSLRYAQRELPEARIDRDALEAASFALMLPFTVEITKASSMGVMSLSDRCLQAADLLLGAIGSQAPEDLLDRATRILVECPRKGTALAEARVLADAINIEDFGVGGICRSAALLIRPGGPLSQLTDAYEKRDQYGYWEARLKDSFHFNSTRELAESRLSSARDCLQTLIGELQEDLA